MKELIPLNENTFALTKSLETNSGIRLNDAEYSSLYVKSLRNWMKETSNEEFENKLIDEGFISLQIDAQLGLDLILDSLSPPEEMAFERRATLFVELSPEKHFRDRVKNELNEQSRNEEFLREMSLSKMDYAEATSLAHGIDQSPKVFRIPEPPYAETCRNSPPDLKISHLRSLRIDGYFDSFDLDMQIAAYLISKGHWQQYNIETFFPHVITWERFISAQSKVHHHVGKTWPDLFSRIENVKRTLTKKQLLAFETRYDIDLRPTLVDSAKMLKIALSSLKERLLGVKKRLRLAFPDFLNFQKSKYTKSRETDLLYDGLYRKSKAAIFLPGIKKNMKIGIETKVTESIHNDQPIYDSGETEKIRAWLRSKHYEVNFPTST